MICVRINQQNGAYGHAENNNKIADYFASGNPVLNCGACEEAKMLISKYEAGMNYQAEDEESLKNAIKTYINNKGLMKVHGMNARKLAEEKFDRKTSHQKIIDLIDHM